MVNLLAGKFGGEASQLFVMEDMEELLSNPLNAVQRLFGEYFFSTNLS